MGSKKRQVIYYLILIALFLTFGCTPQALACQRVGHIDDSNVQMKEHNPYRAGINQSPMPVVYGSTARTVRYQPDEGGFSITNGNERFNRPLYIGNDGARFDAGDRPEFALYLPGKGGVLRFGLVSADKVMWLLEADTVRANYTEGRMIYEVYDALLGEGHLEITAVPVADLIGAIIEIRVAGSVSSDLIWAYGGATGEIDFRGDIGYMDIVKRYELRPEECRGAGFRINDASFLMQNGQTAVSGIFPEESIVRLGDASQWEKPEILLTSDGGATPVVVGRVPLASEKVFHLMLAGEEVKSIGCDDLAGLFDKSVKLKREIATRVKVNTPDPYVNSLVPALNIAADALWDGENWYMHGNVAWRIALIGWRIGYTGDVSGRSDRTRMHIRNSLSRQITEGSSVYLKKSPVWGRDETTKEKVRAFYSDGHLEGQMEHYNFNLVLIDVLMRHLLWTGDLEFAREIWPNLKRHLAWEKRLFDRGGLYDAMPAIWASDALQYNGGGVAYTTAYNFYHNKMAARIATLIGEDPGPYEAESTRIHNAMQKGLWLENDGVYAEFRDIMGDQKVHPEASLASVYHSIDSEVPDGFQAWQMGRYIEKRIPHIPIHGDGVPEGNWSVLPTSTWMPYIWSVNNVSPDEIYHTALACWQAGRNNLAWQIFMGSVIENMYRGICPGNAGMTNSFDAYRGESIRDFGTIATLGRSVVEGLFGVVPDMLSKTVTIRPGWPMEWEYASFSHPLLEYSFQRNGQEDHYRIISRYGKSLKIRLIIPATGNGLDVYADDLPIKAANKDDAIGFPCAVIETEISDSTHILIRWKGKGLSAPSIVSDAVKGEKIKGLTGKATISEIRRSKLLFNEANISKNSFSADVISEPGLRTTFVKVKEGYWSWWMPFELEVYPALEIVTGYDGRVTPMDESGALHFSIRNNTKENINSDAVIKVGNWQIPFVLDIPSMSVSDEITVYPENPVPGTHRIIVLAGELSCEGTLANWGIKVSDDGFTYVDMNSYYNDRITEIFKDGKYTKPEPPLVTLGVPASGYGEWCIPEMWSNYLKKGGINDSGFRDKASLSGGLFSLKCGVKFNVPTGSMSDNIVFVSQWETFPREITIPLDGRASHAYLLMAGSTYHMQSRFKNGEIVVGYTNGTETTLPLRNPESWWPVDRDYFVDDYAFRLMAPRPPRILLKSGEEYFRESGAGDEKTSQIIIGGAATVLDLPLDPDRELKSLTLRACANEVVIGIMAVTLVK